MVKLRSKEVRWSAHNLTLKLFDFEPNSYFINLLKNNFQGRPYPRMNGWDVKGLPTFGVLATGGETGEGFLYFHTALSPLSCSTWVLSSVPKWR